MFRKEKNNHLLNSTLIFPIFVPPANKSFRPDYCYNTPMAIDMILQQLSMRPNALRNQFYAKKSFQNFNYLQRKSTDASIFLFESGVHM